MSDLLASDALSTLDSGLVLLSLVILGVFVLTLLFSAYALLLRIQHSRREALQRELRARWEEPVLQAIADPERVPDVHRKVPERYRLHFVQFILHYARRVRGAELETLRKLVDPYLDEIARRAAHPKAEVRTRAVQTLGTLGLPRYEDEVLAGLDDPSPLVSMVAGRYLARPEYPQYGPALMKHLPRFEGWNRNFLASMLAKMSPEIAPVLRDRLLDPEEPAWLRSVYAEALRMRVDPRAGDVAVEALADVSDSDLGASLLRLLAAVGRPEHIDVVRALCQVDDEVIRAQALHALGVLGDTSELPLLFAGMEDESPWAALHAARGVRDAGGAALLQQVARSESEHARLAGQVLYEEQDA